MKSFAILIALMLFAGCVNTYQIGSGKECVSPEDAGAMMDDRLVTLTLLDGQEHEGFIRAITDSTVEILENQHYTRLIFERHRASSLSQKSDATSSIVVGAVIGAALGGVIAYPKGDNQFSDLPLWQTGLGVFVGGFVGGWIGYALTPENRFVFPSPGPRRNVASAAP